MGNSRETRVGILNAVSDWMKLLALAFLSAEVVVLAALYVIKDDDPLRSYLPYALLLFLLIPMIGIFFDRYLQSNSRVTVPGGVPSSTEPGKAGVILTDARFNPTVEKIRSNLQKVANIDIPILTSEVLLQLDNLVLESRAWGRGELHGSVQRYRKVLLDLYAQTENTIFSTTIRDYLTGWPEELMEKMILASENSRSQSITRVFVFGSRNEIDERAIAVLTRFKQSRKIKALVYIDEEDEQFSFPPDISRDFVVFDNGKAIGVTMSYGPDNLRAQWYFGDEDRQRVFQRICRSLTIASLDADEIIKWWREEHG